MEKSETESVAEKMILGGIDLIQLRAKTHPCAEIAKIAAALHDLTVKRGVPLVINDHPEVAQIVRAEGVHVGQDDVPIAQVREIAGQNRPVPPDKRGGSRSSRNARRDAVDVDALLTRALTISDSDPFSPHRPNPITRRSAWRRFGEFTMPCADRSFASEALCWTICLK